VKVNASLELAITEQLIELLKEFKDIFARTYKNLKGIPLEIVQRRIKFDTKIPRVHQVKY
jgi:hypothetical protein